MEYLSAVAEDVEELLTPVPPVGMGLVADLVEGVRGHGGLERAPATARPVLLAALEALSRALKKDKVGSQVILRMVSLHWWVDAWRPVEEELVTFLLQLMEGAC